MVDDPWGPLRLPEGSPAADVAWVTREEAAQELCRDVRMGELLSRMLSA